MSLVPDFHKITANVLFGDVWQDARLDKRDRSLVTVALLMALRTENSLDVHIERALDHGVTRDEICALVTHVGFYAGWGSGEHSLRHVEQQLGGGKVGKKCNKACCR